MNSLANRNFSYDIGKLLNPISEDLPSGVSLRYEPIYDQIREARREDDPKQERGVWTLTLKAADWPLVEKLCVEALTDRTKDLQIAAWLLEAWLRRYGFPGMREGFRLMNALSQDYWDSIHPMPEDGDLDYRIAPFEWANEKLPVVIKLLPITNPTGDSSRPLNWADWETACRPGGADPEDRRRGETPPEMSQAIFQQSVLLTTTEDLAALLEMIDGAIHSLSKLDATLTEKCGNHSPGFGSLKGILTSIRGFVHSALAQRPKPVNPVEEKGFDQFMEDEPVPRGAGELAAPSSGPIRSRAEAYRRLSEAADYLARTEPHSPTPYLIKRAIHWGGMKLEDLLPELVRDSSELGEIYRLLQIRNTSDE
jgi:type VI secretion system protein ImpA